MKKKQIKKSEYTTATNKGVRFFSWEGLVEWGRVLITVAVILGLCGAAFVGIKSCTVDMASKRKASILLTEQSPLKVGDFVRAKVSNQLGIVVQYHCYPQYCLYSVRFNANASRTDVRLFGSDGMVGNYPIVLIEGLRDFELNKVK